MSNEGNSFAKFGKIISEAKNIFEIYEQAQPYIIKIAQHAQQLKKMGDLMKNITDNVSNLGKLIETKMKGDKNE